MDPGRPGAEDHRVDQQRGIEAGGYSFDSWPFCHIMGVAGVKKEYNIPIYASRDEVEVLANPQINVSTMMGAYMSMKADDCFLTAMCWNWRE